MESIALGQLATWIGAVCPPGLADLIVTGVSTDTRALRPGTCFFALGGRQHDGARFVREAFARGARAAVVPPGVDAGGRPALVVADPRQALLDLGAAWRAHLGVKVVGITGSAGKTTTKDLTHHLISGARSAVRAPLSFNNDVGVPLTLLGADRATDVVVVEIGTSGPGEIGRLTRCARPDVAVLTCIAPAHLEKLGSLDGVEREKLSIVDGLREAGLLVLGGDDERLRAAAARLGGRLDVRLAGLSAGASWRGHVAGRDGLRTLLDVHAPGRTEPVRVTLPVPGEPFAKSALLALCVAERLGVPLEAAAERLATFRAPGGRMNLATWAGVTVVDDAYNANPASVGAAIETLSTLAPLDERVLVLGGMAELGPGGPALHQAIGERVARHGVRRLVTVGEAAREIARGARAHGLAPERIVEVAAAEEVAGALERDLRPGRAVLLKGSRVVGLDRAVAALRRRLLAA